MNIREEISELGVFFSILSHLHKAMEILMSVIFFKKKFNSHCKLVPFYKNYRVFNKL